MLALISLVLLGQADPKVTFGTPGRPLKEVFAQLSPLVGEKVLVSGELAEQPVVIQVKDRPWSELKGDLAWVFRASWKDGALARSDADKKALAEAIRLDREELLRKGLEELKRRTAGWGEWTEADLRSTSPDSEYESSRTVAGQALFQIMLKLGAARLSAIPMGAYFAYPAQPGEKEFPGEVLAIVKQAIADQNRQNALSTHPLETSSQAVLFLKDGEYRLVISGESGRPYRQGNWNAFMQPTMNPKPKGSDGEIALSPRARNLYSLMKAMRGDSYPEVLPETRAAISDPVKTDPVELLASEVLLGIANLQKKGIVAAPNHIWVSRLPARTQLPVTERQAWAILEPVTEVEERESTLRLRSTADFPLVRKRSDFRSFVQSLNAARDSQQLAESLLGATSWETFHVGEVLQPLRSLNRSLMVPWPEPNLLALATSREPFRGPLSIPADCRKIIADYLAKNPDMLSLEIPAKSISQGEGAPDGSRPNYYLEEGNLKTLPLRCFPNGIPSEAEVEWIPAHLQTGGFDDVYIGSTEDRGLARVTGAYALGTWLRDARSGARKDQPRFYWAKGVAGGTVTLRFKNGIRLSSTIKASATHPSEKPRPLSELPAEFLKIAEDFSKQPPDRRQPPPSR